tara:strand:- start:28 stop:1065 length:1038 start_codon:yes stop_codon:yes gene_type:complete
MKIGNQNFSSKIPLFVAEISGNHAGDLNILKKTIVAAIKSGANAIKLQTYTPEDLTIKSNKKDFLVEGSKNKWEKKYLYKLYEKGQTPIKWHKEIFRFCKKKKILCFSSPFSDLAVIELQKLNCPAYKVASLEINNIPLLKAIAKTKKPVVISTGGASVTEIKKAVEIFKRNRSVALLKCTVNYPAKLSDSNLLTIKDLKKRFKNCEIGFSDHTIGYIAATSAISLGASIIEKHFVLHKNINSIDSFFSSDPKELKELIKNCKEIITSHGRVFYGPTKSEVNSLKYRRSIYVNKEINVGEKIDKQNIKIVRPGLSLDLKNYDKILGKVSKKKLKIGSRLSLKDLK